MWVNLHRRTLEERVVLDLRHVAGAQPLIRGLHSYTFQLNVSTFCWIHWVVAVNKTAQVKLRSGRVKAPGARRVIEWKFSARSEGS
jgi:hypothetical protein